MYTYIRIYNYTHIYICIHTYYNPPPPPYHA
jgi:hypothetical protein